MTSGIGIVGVILIAIMVLCGVAYFSPEIQRALCPHPVYSHGGMVTESCDGQMPALEGTPTPEAKR